ncbi:MAG: hypothetical protein MMC33_008900 [Icmadophila ericetorum]|nr:hypothetical protein [Icmadophila ericetorum]
MFRKKPNIKNLAPLRSSDRRRIADKIIEDFQLEVEEVQNEEGQTNTELGVGALRNSLLPDGCQTAKFTTTHGPNLKEISGSVYIGAHPRDDVRILWIMLADQMFPSVYTLWRHPKLVPLLHTPDLVLHKLQGGADLMIPGLARGPPFPERARKGHIVAIASLENSSVPRVVGECLIDVSDLGKVQGVKGHAVETLHFDGDEIWAWSQTGKPGEQAPEQIDGWDGAGVSSSQDAQDAQDGRGVELVEKAADTDLDSRPIASEDVSENTPPERNMSTKGKWTDPDDGRLLTALTEIDDAFRNAFLFAMQDHKEKYREDPKHGLDFPIPQSLVISNLILPYLPIFNSAQTSQLQMKKTSWKNVKKFIKVLDKEQLVKSKDRNGGEMVILDVDFNDRAIASFVPYKLPPKDTPNSESGGGGGSRAISGGINPDDTSIGQKLTLVSLLRPKEKLSPLFATSSTSLKSLLLPAELRPIVTSYLESENLISEINKRLVTLNPFLANTIFDGSTSLDREALAKGHIPRDTLIDRIQAHCSPFWAILRNDKTLESVKPKSGHPPAIQIVLETRSGNKTVSKISGVEAFYISPQLLADELQKSCASSTSVGQLVGSSPKNPVMEILVQGSQKDAVTKALEKRGVNKRWVEVVDKTKGKKK